MARCSARGASDIVDKEAAEPSAFCVTGILWTTLVPIRTLGSGPRARLVCRQGARGCSSHPASQWPRHFRALQTVEMAFLRCVFNAKGKSVKRNSCMQRHYYICKTRKIVWPNEAMDARLSTVLAEIQLLQSCVQTSVPRGFARYLQTAHGTDLKTVARRPNLSHSTDRKIYQSEACKNARYNVGCQWTFKNAEGGGVIVSSDSFGRWTQQSFSFHPYRVTF